MLGSNEKLEECIVYILYDMEQSLRGLSCNQRTQSVGTFGNGKAGLGSRTRWTCFLQPRPSLIPDTSRPPSHPSSPNFIPLFLDVIELDTILGPGIQKLIQQTKSLQHRR